jgi:hypothetical protein
VTCVTCPVIHLKCPYNWQSKVVFHMEYKYFKNIPFSVLCHWLVIITLMQVTNVLLTELTVSVKLSLCLTKYHSMKAYPLLN